MRPRTALFRFDASPLIGAGHAIRSCVIADALIEKGWICKVIATSETYDFITSLERFSRIEPTEFYNAPLHCDLLVIDHYDLDKEYEKYFRPFAKKIMVIDDLVNRKHACDILVDQTYGRDADDYKELVPENSKIFAGSEYVLLRNGFIEMRPQALAKRRNTKEIKKVLISMGGSDSHNHTLKALDMLKEAGFIGEIVVVLGFNAPYYSEVENHLKALSNKSEIHIDANMPQLIYEADLAIGAAGSGIWERYCLGLPQVLMVVADNQKSNFISIEQLGLIEPLSVLLGRDSPNDLSQKLNLDGFGVNRILSELEADNNTCQTTFRKITEQDKELIYHWQNMKEVRTYFNNPNPPSIAEHALWFSNRIRQTENPYWIICHDNHDCGVMSLSYNHSTQRYDLSWFIIPEKRGMGLGTEALKIAVNMVHPFKIHAFVKEDNIASHKVFKKLGFLETGDNSYTSTKNIGGY